MGNGGESRWETDMDLDLLCLMFLFLWGLLNCLRRVVGRPDRTLRTTFSQPFTCLLLTFGKMLALKVRSCYFQSAHLSSHYLFLSQSASINYIQLHFNLLTCSYVTLSDKSRTFSLPVQEFPIWNLFNCFERRARKGNYPVSGKDRHQPFYLLSLHGNKCRSLCTQSKGPMD